MKKSVKLTDFNLEKFIKTNLAFYKTILSENINPSDIVQEMVDADGRVRDIAENESRDLNSELTAENKELFFPFTDIGLNESLRCADGGSYKMDEDSEFCLGETEQAGFLTIVDKGNIYFKSAVFYPGAHIAPPPSLEICDCDVFDGLMSKYLENFIKK